MLLRTLLIALALAFLILFALIAARFVRILTARLRLFARIRAVLILLVLLVGHGDKSPVARPCNINGGKLQAFPENLSNVSNLTG